MGDLMTGRKYEFCSCGEGPGTLGVFLGKQTRGRSSRPNRMTYRNGNKIVKAYSFGSYTLEEGRVLSTSLDSVELSDAERAYCAGLLERAGL